MQRKPRGTTLQIEALGQDRTIGSLYDANQGIFLTATFFRSTPKTSLMDITNSQLDYHFEDDFNDKFNKIDVEAELKIKILAGLVDLEGSGKYYTFDSKKRNTIRVVLKYKYMSCLEEIDYYQELPIFTDIKAKPTHFVDRIEYGACVNVIFDSEVIDEKDESKIKGLMKAAFKKVSFEIGGQAKVNITEDEKKTLDKFSINIQSDIAFPKNRIPRTLEDIIDYIRQVPKLIKETTNKGRGNPVLYSLCPITHFEGSLTTKVNKFDLKMDSSFLLDLEMVFTRFQKALKKLQELESHIEPLKEIAEESWTLVRKQKDELRIKENTFKSRANNCLDILRRREKSQENLDYLKETLECLNSQDGPRVYEEFSNTQMRDHGAKWELFHHYLRLGVIILPMRKAWDNFLVEQAYEQKIFVLFYKNHDNTNNKNLFRNLIEIESNTTSQEETKTDEANKNNTIFVVADLETNETLKDKGLNPCIQLFQNRYKICSDYLKYMHEELNLIRSSSTRDFMPLTKPVRAQKLRVPCPNSGNCIYKTREWVCSECLEPIYLDLVEMRAYCKHEFSLKDAEFRCSDPAHGHEFVKLKNDDASRDILQLLKNAIKTSQAATEQVYIWENRDKYFGNLYPSPQGFVRKGWGTYVWKGKDYEYKLEAAWNNNVIAGRATFCGPEDQKYQGAFSANGNKFVPIGKGTFIKEKTQEIDWSKGLDATLKGKEFFIKLQNIELQHFDQDFPVEFKFIPKINQDGRKAVLGSNGKYYCGSLFEHQGQCACTDKRVCGKFSGCNCLACMMLDVDTRRLPEGFWVNNLGITCQKQNNNIFCGRKISIESNEYCNPQEKKNCPECKLLEIQISFH